MRYFFLLFFTLFFVCFVGDVKAQIVVVDKEGDLRWNVLSDKIVLSDVKPSEVSITKITDLPKKTSNSSIELSKVGDRLNMVVASENQKKTFEVTSFADKIVEIEERPAINKIEIFAKDGKFVISQNEARAFTYLPIFIDPKEAKISLKTVYGESDLVIFPHQAALITLRSKLLSLITNELEILSEDGNVFYRLLGEKHFSFYSFYTYKIPVTAYVSVSTGEIIKIDSPTWYKYLSFLFV